MISLQSYKTVDKQLKSTSTKMEELRQQQSGTDVTMKCKGGFVYAHNCFLIASSPYFEKMLTTDMCEKNSRHINFNNYSKEVIEIIIQYLYTAILPNLTSNYFILKELVQTCHLMEIRELLTHIWDEITKHLSMETFAELWAYAVKFDLCSPNGTIENYAKTNIEEISNISKLNELDENQIDKFIECIDDKRYIRSCIGCIFKWNQNSTRNECAAKLLQKANLQFLDDTHLNTLLKSRTPEISLTSIDGVLINEAVARLPSRYQTIQMYRSSLKSIKERCNKRCNLHQTSSTYHKPKCHVEVEMANIKIECDKFLKQLELPF